MKNKIFYMILIVSLCFFAKNVKALDEKNIYFEDMEVTQHQNAELIRNSVETSDGGFIIIKNAAIDGTVEEGCENSLDLHGVGCYEPISYIVKYDSNENIEWINSLQTFKDSQLILHDIIETKDGNYIAVGEKDFKGYILKIDKLGNGIWEKEYIFYKDLLKDKYGDKMENISSSIKTIVETSSNNFLISVFSDITDSHGSSLPFVNPYYGLLVIDSNGDIINSPPYYKMSSFQGSGRADYFSDMVELESGDFICTAKMHENVILVRFDNNLNVLWEKKFRKNDRIFVNENDAINFLTKTDDGYFILYYNDYSPFWIDDNNIFHNDEYFLTLIKFDEDGEIIEENHVNKNDLINYDDIDIEFESEEEKEYYYSTFKYEIMCLKKTSKDELLFIASIHENYTIKKLVLGKIDQRDGSVIWKKDYEPSDDDLETSYLFHLVETKKGNLYATGFISDYYFSSFSSQILKIKLSYNVDIPNSEYGTVTSDTDKAFVGDTIKLSIEPIEGYEVDKITITCENDPSKIVEVNNNSFEMPDDNVKVLVTFKKIVLEEEKPEDNNNNNDNDELTTIDDKEESIIGNEDNAKPDNIASSNNPHTGDKIVIYILTIILSIIVSTVLLIKLWKRKRLSY